MPTEFAFGGGMKALCIFCLVGLSACGASGLSYAGLTYDSEDQMFYGVAKTPPSAMPATGTATMSGKWKGTSFDTSKPGFPLTSHSGDASLDVDFGRSSVTLNLFGDFVRVFSGGTISGSSFQRRGITEFWGDFYGDSAGIAAGWFSDHDITDTKGTSGEFIVAN